MSLLDSAKSMASELSMKAKEFHVKLEIVSGKQYLNLGRLDRSVVLRQNNDGYIYFDTIEGFYKIVDYKWDGPVYETVSETTSTVKKGGKDKTGGKEKRTGRLTGAIVGSIIAPGPGTLIGAMVGTGNKKTNSETKHHGVDKGKSVTREFSSEIPATAYLTLKDPKENVLFSFAFKCDSQVNGEMMNLLHTSKL